MDAWVLKRAAKLLFRLESMDLWNLFHHSLQPQGNDTENDNGRLCRDILAETTTRVQGEADRRYRLCWRRLYQPCYARTEIRDFFSL
jgi:hypothetical protein